MKTFTLSLFLLVSPFIVFGQSGGTAEPAKPKVTRNMQAFLDATELGHGADTLCRQITEAFMEKRPRPAKKFFQRLKAEVSQREMMKILAPILARHFTDEQMGEMARSIQAKEKQPSTPEMDAFMAETTVLIGKWAIGIFEMLEEEYRREVQEL